MYFFLDIDHPFLTASLIYLNLAFVVGNVWWNLDVHTISNAINVFLFFFVNVTLFLKTEPPSLKHGAYYDQIQGKISFTKRKWCILYIQLYTCNGSFQETTVFDRFFFSDMVVGLEFYFYLSFVLPVEIHSMSLQTLLILESSNVQSAEPMEIDNFKGDLYFCPECKSVILNEVTELRDRSIWCDFCKLWHHFHCVSFTNTHAKCLTTAL